MHGIALVGAYVGKSIPIVRIAGPIGLWVSLIPTNPSHRGRRTRGRVGIGIGLQETRQGGEELIRNRIIRCREVQAQEGALQKARTRGRARTKDSL